MIKVEGLANYGSFSGETTKWEYSGRDGENTGETGSAGRSEVVLAIDKLPLCFLVITSIRSKL